MTSPELGEAVDAQEAGASVALDTAEPDEHYDGTLTDFPEPTTDRWQPLRLGLVDLFYYENEVFPFVDGRL